MLIIKNDVFLNTKNPMVSYQCIASNLNKDLFVVRRCWSDCDHFDIIEISAEKLFSEISEEHLIWM